MRVFVGQPLVEPSTTELLAGHTLVTGGGNLPRSEWTLLRDADALLPTPRERITAEVLAAAPQLRIVASHSVGVDHIDLAACRRRGILVTNTPDVLTDATADLTWALILAVARRIREGEALARSGTWDGWKPQELLGISLSGRTLGIYGMGRIGRAVARRGEAFGMNVLSFEKGGTEEELGEFLWKVDVLSIHAPLTEETRGRFGDKEFLRMKEGAILINTARGPIVDEEALVAALSSRHLLGAGLDVYEREPQIHPGLVSLPNVVLLPHLGSATFETRLAMARLACEEIARFARGHPPLHPVL
ncbi:MAG TPA: D-glycerate dehydrogenase [Thermoanaerobaculia bacterium]|nr:D-glycerate dehydrogenase [Thermoanaerobaculia bacterium]